jgi:SAM-dependent methyltransferase
VDVATFEAWNPAGREFDAVVAGQAWHWIDPVAGAAQAARVLRPGGLLAPVWNAFQLPPDVATAYVEAFRHAIPDAPFDITVMTRSAAEGYRPLLAKAADGIREAGGFGDPEQWRFDWEFFYTRDAWLDQMRTHGTLAGLAANNAGKVGEVLAAVGAAIDAMGGGFRMPYTTVAVTATRTGT